MERLPVKTISALFSHGLINPSVSFLFFLRLLFIYLFLAVLGLRFCARAFSSCGKRGPLFIAVHGPLTIVASLVAEHRLQTCRLSSCGSRAQLLCGMWDLPRPRARTCVPCISRQTLNHCATREVLTASTTTLFCVKHYGGITHDPESLSSN